MLIIGLVLIIFAIWINISTQIMALKPLGVIAGILGIYLILRFKRNE